MRSISIYIGFPADSCFKHPKNDPIWVRPTDIIVPTFISPGVLRLDFVRYEDAQITASATIGGHLLNLDLSHATTFYTKKEDTRQEGQEGGATIPMVIRRANKEAVGYLDQGKKITEDYLVHMGFDMLNKAKSILEKATGPSDTEDTIGRATKIRRDLAALERIVSVNYKLKRNSEHVKSLHTLASLSMGHNEVFLFFDIQALMTHIKTMIRMAVALKHQPEDLQEGGTAEETATAIYCMTFLRVLAYMLAEIFSDLRAHKDEPPFNTYNAHGEPYEE